MGPATANELLLRTCKATVAVAPKVSRQKLISRDGKGEVVFLDNLSGSLQAILVSGNTVIAAFQLSLQARRASRTTITICPWERAGSLGGADGHTQAAL